MMEDVRDYNKEILKQEKTPEQLASWVSGNEVSERNMGRIETEC